MTTTQPPDTAPHDREIDAGDGRTARRERNRSAVVDALLDLYHEGELQPSADAIAERAGLSPRSLFRYFDDGDDLCRVAIARHRSRATPLLPVAAGPGDSLEVRIDAIVAQRAKLFDAVGVISVISRLRAPFQPLIQAELTEGRSYLRHQLEKLFAPELAAFDRTERSVVLSALDILCSFESYDLLRRDQGLSRRRAGQVMRSAIRAQLAWDGVEVGG